MFGIRKKNYPTLMLHNRDARSIDPGPTIGKKIKQDIDIPAGWYKGRTFKEGYKRVWN